jgi:hypothetical protein
MHPDIHLNWIAIAVSVVVSFAVGGLWYGPLFGAAWRKEMGVPADAKPMGGAMGKSLGINIVGTFLTAFVLAHEVAVWRPSVWHAGADSAPAVYGFFAGFFTWLGFAVPVLLNGVSFEGKSGKLFAINAAFLFVSFEIIAMILSFWR